MNLHKDKMIFNDFIEEATDHFGLNDAGIVEKDYYVTLFLKDISERQPGLIFKGGTSLSKCHKVIHRFSEDIDLSMETEAARPSQSQRVQLKRNIISVIDDNGFTLLNPEQVQSRRDYNRYLIDYDSIQTLLPIKQYLFVETSVFIRSFPTESLSASSMIYDYLNEMGSMAEISRYDLSPFYVNVLSTEGSFVDKVFALGDYYLTNIVNTHSRHIYDLYKIFPKIEFDSTFKGLVSDIRKARKLHAAYCSAQDGVDMVQLLRTIVAEDYYKRDYEQTTRPLLFEDVPYSEAVKVIEQITDSGCF